MLSLLPTFISQLHTDSLAANCRRLVIVEGDLRWATQITQLFSEHYSAMLWAGEDAPESIVHCHFKTAKKWLGQETDCIAINAHHGIDANVIGALSGTIKGGGVMLLLLPLGWKCDANISPFMKRLSLLCAEPDVITLSQNTNIPVFKPWICQSHSNVDFASSAPRFCLTQQQEDAVDAIIKVAVGHRKRPLVLSADRGRGKSSALGIAAAELMLARKMKIAVTSPSFACASTVFSHAQQRLIDADTTHPHRLLCQGSELHFIAQDVICDAADKYDFILVDEAAAIPGDTLISLLNRHNRLVFASTIHGYEGTGRGFEIKFKQALNKKMPQWKAVHIEQPIRWQVNDPLEQWVFNALLLNAEFSTLETLSGATISYELVTKAELVTNNNLLSQIVGLLIHAHYQTSPNDVQQLLDDSTQHVLVARSEHHVIGCCLLVEEGGFDDDLAQAVMLGQRRIKGHLLAQSIAAHLGLKAAAKQSCYRILRIAVLPVLHRKGIGQQLLSRAEQYALACGVDYIGTSFGATDELVNFWHNVGFTPIRLGINKDAASSLHSLLCVKVFNPNCYDIWFNDAALLFSASFSAQRVEQFKQLAPELFLRLYRNKKSHSIDYQLSERFIQSQLDGFCLGALGYDYVVASIETRLSSYLLSDDCTRNEELFFAIAKVMQRQAWTDVISSFKFTGRKQAENILRKFVRENLI
ncbi:tRNA(Met) cytidine acetyltransferase TmcA [Photobacterium angustum]|uniref:tRNA(Met) cytidine acetyltransferase TmcA n=1 Tax=Photobacterium angustum TaxID=661 RepID=A0A2S7VHX7_PHOAN|nr:GNAT family N-acetyltransferase [Photobacterium angustum]PQJ61783.1 GNAT family N-acetyltransferase [Photobacterium angustum]